MGVITNNKLSEPQKVQVKALIAKYDGRGWTQHMIVEVIKRQLGISISQPMVGIYRKQMLAETAKAYRGNWEEMVAQKVEQLRDVRREAWDAWVRSSEDAQKLVEEYGQVKEAVGDGDYVTSEEMIKRVITKEGRLPDNAYLNTIMKTLDAERELLGLDECKPGLVTMEQAMFVINAFKDAVREVLQDHPDLWRAVYQRTSALAPLAMEKHDG